MTASGISSRFQLLSQRLRQVSHVLCTRSPLDLPEQAPWTSFDLHVLSTPPAFILSQDQTLQQKRGRPLDRQRVVSERSTRTGKGSCGRSVLADLAEPAPYKGGGRPVSVLLPAGCADSEIDRQFCKVTRRRPDELPALAFCLLFRFQGAEAQARTGPSAFRWGLALVPDRLSGGVNPSVRRRTILTARAWRHNPPPGEISLRCTQDEISRRWCVFLPLRRRTYRPCSRSHSVGKEFSSIVTPFT